MLVLVRLVRIAMATVLCTVVYAALFEFLIAVPHYLVVPDYIEDVENYRRNTPLIGALWWGVVFRAPTLLFFGTVPLLITFIILELLGIKRSWAYLGVWMTGGFVATGMSSGSTSSMIPALLSSGIVGYLYWLLAGRSAGEWIAARKTGEGSGGYRLINYAAYGILAVLGYQLAGYLHYGAKLFWVSHISEPGRGVPPFQIRPNRALTAAQKVALIDFPDPESCLEDGVKTLTPENLKKLDWDRIDNASDAEVCVFRLLGSYENLSGHGMVRGSGL